MITLKLIIKRLRYFDQYHDDIRAALSGDKQAEARLRYIYSLKFHPPVSDRGEI